jgi:Trypsin
MKKAMLTGWIVGAMTWASPSLAIYNGTPDTDFTHQYAGLMFSKETINGFDKLPTCGATLVDADYIPDQYKRRIVITAGHCIRGFSDAAGEIDLWVTFIADPGMVMDTNAPARAPVALNNVTNLNTFAGRGWTPLARQITGVGIGAYKDDYAVIVLSQAVPESMVAQPALLPEIGQAVQVLKKPATVTGYGTVVWGNSNSTGISGTDSNGQAIPVTGAGNILGPRQKMTITMDVISINSWNIEQSMNFALGNGTACNGDSGSGIIDERNPARPVLLSTVSMGDFNCRATNTSTRIDTLQFKNYLLDRLSKNP